MKVYFYYVVLVIILACFGCSFVEDPNSKRAMMHVITALGILILTFISFKFITKDSEVSSKTTRSWLMILISICGSVLQSIIGFDLPMIGETKEISTIIVYIVLTAVAIWFMLYTSINVLLHKYTLLWEQK